MLGSGGMKKGEPSTDWIWDGPWMRSLMQFGCVSLSVMREVAGGAIDEDVLILDVATLR
jgi:hypothetical protein